MGRAPCCDKTKVKKGPWCPEEDDKLKSYIEKYGTGGNWIALPQKIGMLHHYWNLQTYRKVVHFDWVRVGLVQGRVNC